MSEIAITDFTYIADDCTVIASKDGESIAIATMLSPTFAELVAHELGTLSVRAALAQRTVLGDTIQIEREDERAFLSVSSVDALIVITSDLDLIALSYADAAQLATSIHQLLTVRTGA